MINKEENQQNLNISFKLKLIKKPETVWTKTIKYKGLYQQLQEGGHTYNSGNVTVENLKDALAELFYGKQK